HRSIGGRIVLSPFYRWQKCRGYPNGRNFFPIDCRKTLFFVEAETRARNPVIQWERTFLQVLIFKYHIIGFILCGMYMQWISKFSLRMQKMQVDDFLQTGRSVHMQFILAPHEVHGRNQPNQAQVMVTMQMADKDMFNAIALDTVLNQLYLCTLAAIHQVKLFVDINELCSRVTTINRRCRTTS